MAALRIAHTPEELSRFVGEAKPGDRIEWAATSVSAANLSLSATGSSAAPIEIHSRVELTGCSELRISGQHLRLSGFRFRDGGHIRLEGRGHTLRDVSIVEGEEKIPTDTKWLSLYGESHLVERCHFTGKKNSGATVVVWLSPHSPCGRHQIRHNYFGPRPPLGANGGETLRVGDSSTSLLTAACLIENNFFEACDGEIEAISNKSCGNIYRGNVFLGCAATLTLRHGNSCRVENNIFDGQSKPLSGGVRIIGEDHWVESNIFVSLRGTAARAPISLVKGVPDTPLNGYAQVKRAVVSGNEIFDCTDSIALNVDARGATLPAEDCWIASNLIHASKPHNWRTPRPSSL